MLWLQAIPTRRFCATVNRPQQILAAFRCSVLLLSSILKLECILPRANPCTNYFNFFCAFQQPQIRGCHAKLQTCWEQTTIEYHMCTSVFYIMHVKVSNGKRAYLIVHIGQVRLSLSAALLVLPKCLFPYEVHVEPMHTFSARNTNWSCCVAVWSLHTDSSVCTCTHTSCFACNHQHVLYTALPPFISYDCAWSNSSLFVLCFYYPRCRWMRSWRALPTRSRTSQSCS